MKTEFWVSIFLVVVLSLAIPFYFGMHSVSKGVKENHRMKQELYSSCKDAIEQVNPGLDLVFDNPNKREQAINSFYDTLAANENLSYTAGSEKNPSKATYIDSVEDVRYHVPCVVMVDWDGFYISYSKTIKNSDSDVVAGKVSQKYIVRNITSEKYSFGQDIPRKGGSNFAIDGADFHAYNVRATYNLDDKLQLDIIGANGVKGHYEGDLFKTYSDFFYDYGGSNKLLKEWFGGMSLTDFKKIIEDEKEISDIEKQKDLVADDDADRLIKLQRLNERSRAILEEIDSLSDNYRIAYHEFKNVYISSILENQIEYYINLHNDIYNTKKTNYIFTMPNMEKKDLHKMVKAPCVVAFMQGAQRNDVKNGSSYINVYSICGSELLELRKFVTSPKFTNSGDGIYYKRVDDPSTAEDESKDEIIVRRGYISNSSIDGLFIKKNDGKLYRMEMEYHESARCKYYRNYLTWKAETEATGNTVEKKMLEAFLNCVEQAGSAKENAKEGINPCSVE